MLWRRLAVFSGGFTLAAVEAVAGGDGLTAGAILNLLAQLADKSLLVTDRRGAEVRYRLLEPLRQYGWEQLRAAGEVAAVQARHLEWCRAVAESAAPKLAGPAQGQALAQLEQEHDNLRAALGTALAGVVSGADPPIGEEMDPAVRLAAALGPFWDLRGHLSEGRRWLTAALDLASAGTELRAGILEGLALLVRSQGESAQAATLLTEALAIRRQRGDRRGEAQCLFYLGRVAMAQCQFRRAQGLLAGSLAAWQRLGDPWGLARVRFGLGTAAYHLGDFPRAREMFAASRADLERLGDQHGATQAIHGLAVLDRVQGDYDGALALHVAEIQQARHLGARVNLAQALLTEADTFLALGDAGRAAPLLEEGLSLARDIGLKSHLAYGLYLQGVAALQGGAVAAASLEEGLALGRAIGDKYYSARCLHSLGRLARAQGDDQRALSLALAALQLRWEMGDRLGMAQSLEDLAGLMPSPEQPTLVARFLGAAAALRAAIGAPIPAADRPGYDRDRAAVKSALGEAAFAAGWDEGQTRPLAQAVAAALALGGIPLPPVGDEAELVGEVAAAELAAATNGAEATANAPPAPHPAGLTRREVEIARLVAEGLTDREVALRLHISPRTVDTHLRNIFGKVDVSSRAGLATWVTKQGLDD